MVDPKLKEKITEYMTPAEVLDALDVKWDEDYDLLSMTFEELLEEHEGNLKDIMEDYG